jgi:hypothetical protein
MGSLPPRTLYEWRRNAAKARPGEDPSEITGQESAMEADAVAILVDHDVEGCAIWLWVH